VITTVPATPGVYRTVHTAEPPLPASAHDRDEKLPDPPDELSDTIPAGNDGLAPVSVTVAVHAVERSTCTGFGEQLTTICVGCVTAVRMPESRDAACPPSPPYDAVITTDPATPGVYRTVHTAEPPLPASAHDDPNRKLPDPDELSDTIPVGNDGFAPVSVTVAVHAVEAPACTGFGEHLTTVCVRSVPTTRELEPLDAACPPSPPYDAVITTDPATPGV